MIELLVVLMLIPIYGYLATYMCHPSTSGTEYMDGLSLSYEPNGNYQALAYIVVFFSSYSLIGAPIPENTPYGTDDSFSLVSHHYQRILYQIIVIGITLGLD